MTTRESPGERPRANLCLQIATCATAPSGSGISTPPALDGSSFSQHSFSTTRETYAAAAPKVLPPGTFNVGMCVRNNGSSTINNNYVNGWVMVTS